MIGILQKIVCVTYSLYLLLSSTLVQQDEPNLCVQAVRFEPANCLQRSCEVYVFGEMKDVNRRSEVPLQVSCVVASVAQRNTSLAHLRRRK
ncbi:hypothetical protein Q1695_014731 [Nippostrongylus brasiliensis]|nr:hypothetical protein Q1695_014731 [Nippostrongylus brasiliensis]